MRTITEQYLKILTDIGAIKWTPASIQEAVGKLVELGYAEFGKQITLNTLKCAADEFEQVSKDRIQEALEHHEKAGRNRVY